MENCSIKRLNGTFEDVSLKRLGAFRFKNGESNNAFVKLLSYSGEPVKVRIIIGGDYSFYEYSSQTIKTAGEFEITVSNASGDSNSYYFNTGNNGYIDIIPQGDFVTKGFAIESKMNYQDNLSYLEAYSPFMLPLRIFEHVKFGENPKTSEWMSLVDENSELELKTKIKMVNQYGTNFVYDVTDGEMQQFFGECINLEALYLGPDAEGIKNVSSLHAIASAQVALGRTSGTITTYADGVDYYITFSPSAQGGYTITT